MHLLLLIFFLCSTGSILLADETNIEAYFEQRRFWFRKKYAPRYHVSAPIGSLNDPSGFIFFQDRYHLFYQYRLLSSTKGAVHWGHVVSSNLVDWYHYPNALTPKENYEKDGCLAGSALIHNGYLTLFYTGHVFANNRSRQSQNMAITSDGIQFQKYIYNPIINELPTGSGDFRNPKVWSFRNKWYMIVGTSTSSNRGCIVLYTSDDLFHWYYNGTLAQSLGDMGFMWEKPDLFEIDGTHVLIVSVQGYVTDRYNNIFQTGYILCSFNYATQRFDDFELSANTFNELDYGHDFYAAQTTTAHDGRQVLVGWLGIRGSLNDESRDGFSSQLTMIREIKLSSTGKLLMLPAKEYIHLRKEVLEDAWYSPGEGFIAGTKAYELTLNTTSNLLDVIVAFEWDGERQYIISYNADRNFIAVDRGGVDGIRRAPWVPKGNFYLRIFVDASSIEVYCGDGEVVFSTRIYPKNKVRVTLGGDTQLHVVQYKLRRSVRYDQDIRKMLLNHLRDHESELLFQKVQSNTHFANTPMKKLHKVFN